MRPGETVAIVGPTGAGKTTIVNLLMRFYEIDEGRVLLDSARRQSAQARRREAHLRHGAPGHLAVHGHDQGQHRLRARRRHAKRRSWPRHAAAHVDHFVRTQPEGYDTVVDEDASNISAGQKQLITIARAFVANPTILILDEATSSVDTRTEVLIQQAMARCAMAARALSSLTASRRSATRTRSWSWTPGASSSRAATPSCSQAQGFYARALREPVHRGLRESA